MSEALDAYERLLDTLRENRRDPTYTPEKERDFLDVLSEAFERLDEHDEATARANTWRAWPDLYDARVKGVV